MINREDKIEKAEDSREDLAAERARDVANREDQASWLKLHALRTVSVDVAAIVCFYEGFEATFA